MESTLASNPVMENFLESFREFKTSFSHTAPRAHQDALEALDRLSFPTTRDEEWKYTRTTRISSAKWKINKGNIPASVESYLVPGIEVSLVVFVNGFFQESLSKMKTEDGILLQHSLADAEMPATSQSLFDALNIAYNTSVLSISVQPGKEIKTPVHILHLVTEDASLAQPRIFIHTGTSSSLEVMETFAVATEARSFTNRSLHISVGSNAKLDYHKFQVEQDENFLLNEDTVHVADDARFTINTLTIDGGWVRNSLNISLDGKNIEANLSGFYLPRKKQLVDNHTRVDHRFAHCNSNELYKGILNGNSIGVFNGKVYVQPDAQKTNAYQSNANILLSDDAQINTKPELEIYADDVKCSHGSTTGQMDANALFYLKSRGLSDESAKKLLTTAFVQEVIDKINSEKLKEYTINELVKRDLLFV